MEQSLRTSIITILALIMLVVVSPVGAAAEWPTATGWVNDYAGIFSGSEKAEMERTIAEIEAAQGAEISVVTLQTTGELTPKEYVIELFGRWGIGKQGADNGLLILIAVDERRVEVEVGYGLEGVLPDGKVGQLLDRSLMAEFKAGRFGAGVLSFLNYLRPILAGENGFPTAEVTPEQSNNNPLVLGVILFFLVIFGGSLLAITKLSRGSGAKCPQCGSRLSVQRTVLREPTEADDGLQNVIYSCSACSYQRTTEVVLPALVAAVATAVPHVRLGPFAGPRRGGGGHGGFGGFGGGRSGGGGAGRGW